MFTFHDFLNVRTNINRTEFSQFMGTKISKPKWLVNTPKDKLHLVYDNFNELFEHGEVYLSCILRANTSLFHQINGDRPAQVLYTNDEFFYTQPEELLKMVDTLYKIKNDTSYEYGELSELREILNGEYCRPLNYKLPLSITNDKNIWLTSIMVFREHIPFHKMSNFFYPFLALPDKNIGGMIVPKWYWSTNFRRYINFTYDNKVKSITYKDIPSCANDFFEPFSSKAFFEEHPIYYLIFTLLELVSLVTPLTMYIKICDIITVRNVSNINTLVGLIGTLMISFGFINVIWSFMDKYLGNVMTAKMFISGIALVVISIILMIL